MTAVVVSESLGTAFMTVSEQTECSEMDLHLQPRTAANSGRTSQNTGLEPPDLGPLNPPDFGAPGLASLRGLRPPGLRALELSATSKE